jgi:hypothetical protein
MTSGESGRLWALRTVRLDAGWSRASSSIAAAHGLLLLEAAGRHVRFFHNRWGPFDPVTPLPCVPTAAALTQHRAPLVVV